MTDKTLSDVEVASQKWHRCKTIDEMEAFYRSALPAMKAAARECGYALAVHGSMRRDLDLIAAPWTEEHTDPDTLADHLQLAACGIKSSGHQWDHNKPCGRIATEFPICWTSWHDMVGAGHVDLSVMPDTEVQAKRANALEAECDLLRMQAAACMTATLQNTRESAKQRIGRDNQYWTQAYQDVCDAVDREIEWRERAQSSEHNFGIEHERAESAERRLAVAVGALKDLIGEVKSVAYSPDFEHMGPVVIAAEAALQEVK
jgi:hypothetical protein